MDPKAVQEWTSCEVEEFKALFPKIQSKNAYERMELLAKRFPAKTMQQLSDQYVSVFVETLFVEEHGEPSSNDAIADLHDWYQTLEGDTHDTILDPSVETTLNQPSKQLVVEAAGNQEAVQMSYCQSMLKRRQGWTAEEHRMFLLGVQRFGRGEWKAISAYFVPSRTPTQLASHAQKYFKRLKQNELHDKRRRRSINDVNLVDHDQASLLLDQTGGTGADIRTHPSRKKSLGSATNRRHKNNKRGPPAVSTAHAPQDIMHYGQGSNNTINLASETVPNNQYNLHPNFAPF
ncbi:hypothetical protein ACP70R_044819 [Stipagrostis hirtigluma subsp. patula]